MRWVMAFVIVMGMQAVAFAGVGRKLIVAKDGSGRFTKVQAAVDDSRPGDQIVVKTGEYFESVRIEGKSDLTIEGSGNVWLKADGDSEILTVSNSSNVTVRGINGIHTSEGGCYNNVFGIFDSRGVAFYNCIANGSGIYGFDISNSTGIILADNEIVHCSSVGISMDKASHVSIVRNVLSENQDWRTLTASASQKIVFKNNTIVRNIGVPLVLTYCEGVQFYNNIVAFNRHTDDKQAVLNATENSRDLNFQNNIIYANQSGTGQIYDFDNMGAESAISGLLDVDPKLIDVYKGNYRLGRGSPGLQSGFQKEDMGALGSSKDLDIGHWLWLGESATNQRQFDVALFFDQAVLARQPNDISAHIGAGNALLKMLRFDEAAFHYQKTLNLDGKNFTAMYNFACLYALKHEISTALNWLENALRAGLTDKNLVVNDPDLANLHDQRRFHDLLSRYLRGIGDAEFDEGVRYYQGGDWLNAQRVFQKITAEKPQLAEAHYYLGLIAESRQLYSEALNHYGWAVSIKPDYSEAFLGMGNAYFAFQSFFQAAEQYKRCIQIDPNNVTAYSNLGALYAVQKDIGEAEYYLMQGYRIKPDDPTLCYNLACLYSLQHRMDDALTFLEKAMQNGYRDVQHMKQDSDLDFVRDHPRFQDLLRQFGDR